MSVVAGCLLLDGVLLTADTRITYSQSDADKVYVDNALKVFPFAPGTAIGYTGDVETASVLLRELIEGRNRRKRIDPVSLSLWIPRLLQAAFKRIPHTPDQTVSFMVASSLEGRPTIVEREKVGKILIEAVSNGLTGLSGTLSLDILASTAPFVLLPNSCAAYLYAMHSPTFEPRFCPPLSYMTIGSGQGAIEDVQRAHARILFEDVWWFRDAVQGFAERTNVDSVGGLYPVLRVRGNELAYYGQSTKTIKQGTSEIEAVVTLTFEESVWIQRNHVNGKAIPLEPPWNLPKFATQNRRFDDIDRRRWKKKYATPLAGKQGVPVVRAWEPDSRPSSPQKSQWDSLQSQDQPLKPQSALRVASAAL